MIGSGCDISEPDSVVFTGMEPVEIHDTQVPEPSGLTLNTANTLLYTVSDPSDNRIYKIDLDGTLLSVLSYHGDDLEGITYDDRDQTLWVVEERLREIVHLDTLGNELSRHSVDFPGEMNSGLEGICLLPDGRFFVLNEMNPGAIIELDPQLNLTNVTEMQFAVDFSGICHAGSSDNLIIVSDVSKTITVLNSNLEIIHTEEIEFNKMEGIDYDLESQKLFLVNDGSTKLYIYDFEY